MYLVELDFFSSFRILVLKNQSILNSCLRSNAHFRVNVLFMLLFFDNYIPDRIFKLTYQCLIHQGVKPTCSKYKERRKHHHSFFGYTFRTRRDLRTLSLSREEWSHQMSMLYLLYWGIFSVLIFDAPTEQDSYPIKTLEEGTAINLEKATASSAPSDFCLIGLLCFLSRALEKIGHNRICICYNVSVPNVGYNNWRVYGSLELCTRGLKLVGYTSKRRHKLACVWQYINTLGPNTGFRPLFSLGWPPWPSVY